MRPTRRVFLLGSLALVAPGCSNTFQSEGEERNYLTSLSDPTPEQRKRLKQLREAEEQKRPAERAKP